MKDNKKNLIPVAVVMMVVFVSAGRGKPEELHPLSHAARSGKPEEVRKLLRDHPDWIDTVGINALAAAASAGHSDVAELLLEAGVDPNETYTASPPLHIAALEGHTRMVEVLLKRGAAVDSIDNEGRWRALHWAAYFGHSATVKVLLENGASVDLKTLHGKTPLHCACVSGDPRVVSFLLKGGADPGLRTPEDRTPVDVAIEEGHEKITLKLMNKGGTAGEGALHYAAKFGFVKVIGKLIKQGAEVKKKDDLRGWAPIHYAAGWGQPQALKLLVKNGSDVSWRTRDGLTPLLLASSAGHAKTVAVLLRLEAGLRESCRFRFLMPPFPLTVQPGRPASGKALSRSRIDALALANKKMQEWRPIARALLSSGGHDLLPIHAAAVCGHEDVMKVLLEHTQSISVNTATDEDFTPLHYGAIGGDKKVVSLLLSKKAQVNAQTNGGKTPLHYAAQIGRYEATDVLLEGGASLTVVDSDGKTAEFYARRRGHRKLLRLLLEKSRERYLISRPSRHPI